MTTRTEGSISVEQDGMRYDTRAFVMSPAGMWAWLVWLALLIGGSCLVYGSAKEPKR